MLTLTTKAEEASEEATRYKKDLVATQEALTEMKEKAEAALAGNEEKDAMIAQNLAQMENLQEKEREMRQQHHELRQEHEALVARWVTKCQELAVHQNELNEAKNIVAAERAKVDAVRAQGGLAQSMHIDMDIDPNFLSPGFVSVPNSFKTRYECHAADCLSVQYNAATGSQFATASADKTVKLWQTASGDNVATLSGARASCLAAGFSQDDSLILSCSADQAVHERVIHGTG